MKMKCGEGVYPNVTTLSTVRRLKLSAIFIHHCISWPSSDFLWPIRNRIFRHQ